MKKSDIYEIALKIIGLFLIFKTLGRFSESIMYLAFLAVEPERLGNVDQPEEIQLMIIGLVAFLVLLGLSLLLIFKTKRISRLICDKEDYEENVKLLTDKKNIFEIALVIVGLTTIFWTLPEFAIKLRQQIIIIQQDLAPNYSTQSFIILASLRIGLGLIIVIYANTISTLLTSFKREEISSGED